jgi:hypothetical protein
MSVGDLAEEEFGAGVDDLDAHKVTLLKNGRSVILGCGLPLWVIAGSFCCACN